MVLEIISDNSFFDKEMIVLRQQSFSILTTNLTLVWSSLKALSPKEGIEVLKGTVKGFALLFNLGQECLLPILVITLLK